MHKLLLNFALQKAREYPVPYGEHFYLARYDKAQLYKWCETLDSYRCSNNVTITCTERHYPTADFGLNTIPG